jgi:hypothetical protein
MSSEKINLTHQNIMHAIRASDPREGVWSSYNFLENKILIDRGCGDGDALFIKLERKEDKKVFYSIINSEEPIELTTEELNEDSIRKLLSDISLEQKSDNFEFEEYVSEEFYSISDTEENISSLIMRSSSPIDELFEFFSNDEENVSIKIKKIELYPDEFYELPEWEG